MGLLECFSNPRWWIGRPPKFVEQGIPKLSIAVVIPAYNEEATIADTIRSVQSQTVPVDRIIVVNDCSSDRTEEIAREMGVSVVCTIKNQGTKAMAQNYVLADLDTDLVVTIDADTLLAPDAIEKVMPYFNEEKTFAVCGFVIPQKIETIWERGRHIEYVFGITILKAGQNNTGLIMVASGCFTAFRMSVLKDLGLFNERTMAEDMDLTWEALFRGYEVYCEQDAICYPMDPSTMNIYYKQLRRWYSGFLQNLKIHKKDLVRSWKYGLLFSYYLLEAAVYPIAALVLIVMFIDFWKTILMVLAVQGLLLIIPTLYKAWRLKLFWKTLASVPAYYITRPVNVAALYVSIYKEWILGEKLSVWDKGH